MSAALPHRVSVIGGGPAGLMAAEVVRAAGHGVDLYDAMGSVGRKFLLAGKGGLNLTHSEPFDAFAARYREARPWVETWLRRFGADELRAWAREGFAIDTIVGSSGRVFPADLKAAPLLRGWVRRLREQDVRFHPHHRWIGWKPDGSLRFETPRGEVAVDADAYVFALGGASWPELGADGRWTTAFTQAGIAVTALKPSNCGFEIAWSEVFAQRHAGAPVKPVRMSFDDVDGVHHDRQGEFVVTAHGIEGSLVYALSAPLRGVLEAHGEAVVRLDLAPERSVESLHDALAQPRERRSMSEHLRRRAGIEGVKAGLLHEVLPRPLGDDALRLAQAIKSLPIAIRATRPIAEAISSAGGVRADALDQRLMLRDRPGIFCAGEMLDWEAPTGGYLLTACFASGHVAGHGVVDWLARR